MTLIRLWAKYWRFFFPLVRLKHNTRQTHLPKARKLITHCRTEMTCKCFSILDRQGHNAAGRTCRAERMLEPVPGYQESTVHFKLDNKKENRPLILVPARIHHKMGREPEHKDTNVLKCSRRTCTRGPTTSSLTGSIKSHACKSWATQWDVTVRRLWECAQTDHEKCSQGYTRQPRSRHWEANEKEDLASETLATNPISSHWK